MTEARARTALDGPPAPANLIADLSEAPLRGMITLRGDLDNPRIGAAVTAAVGLMIPAKRRFEMDGERGVFWMSPDELMLQTSYKAADATAAAISEALADTATHAETPHLVANVSDARQIFTLKGAAAREILAKGAPIDLHPSAFGVGDIRRTRISAVAAAIYQTRSDPDVFEVFCFRSYADYLWAWLCASAQKGAAPVVFPAMG